MESTEASAVSTLQPNLSPTQSCFLPFPMDADAESAGNELDRKPISISVCFPGNPMALLYYESR